MFELTIALLLFLFPLAYSPGPGNLFFAANGARCGFVSTLNANAGYHLATWLVTLAIGLGFAVFTRSSELLMTVLRFAGSAYVLYLAWCLATAGTSKNEIQASRASFVDGGILLLLNPKAYVIIVLMFSQFSMLEGQNIWLHALWISSIFTLNNFIAFSIWTLAGERLAKLFAKDVQARRQNLFFALLLASVAIWMLLKT